MQHTWIPNIYHIQKCWEKINMHICGLMMMMILRKISEINKTFLLSH